MGSGRRSGRELQVLLPLDSAARLIYARATGHHTSEIDTLNNVARLIATRTRVFSMNADQTARPVSTQDLASGCFVDGGESLDYTDPKRPRIKSLAIRRVDLWDVEDDVRKVYGARGK
jgi:hypothetical protein